MSGYIYDYRYNEAEDVRQWMEDNAEEVMRRYREAEGDLDEVEEWLSDELWADDSVTGNGSGSYYCNAYAAADAVAHNWDLVREAMAEFGSEEWPEDEEEADVCIRCYLLGECVHEAIEGYEWPELAEEGEE